MTTIARPDSLTLHLAASNVVPITSSVSQRTITGLAVPYGPVGHSSVGAITFAQGSLAIPASIGQVKLLLQHDPERVLGYATALDDRPDGMWVTFHVPESEEGDKALQEAADGRRDGLSVGVMLSDETLNTVMQKWMDGDTSPTAAAGELLEISQVSIPAFRSSRIDGSAAAALSGHITLSALMGGAKEVTMASPTKENTMTVETPVSAPASAEVETPAAPPAAMAGAAAHVGGEAPVYTFDGNGPSFVRDAVARLSGDTDAAARLIRMNEMMRRGDTQSLVIARHLTAAVETRATLPNFLPGTAYRGDLLIPAIDRGRPLTSRIGTVPLGDATPFRLPVEGEFTGVGDHTEGTAHVAEGDMTASEVTVTPGAVSGAYRISREAVDATNPGLDIIAIRAMARNYRDVTEGKVAAALLAADASADLNIDTVLELRAALNSFYDANGQEASFVAAATTFYGTLLNDKDTTNRPMLAFDGGLPSAGESRRAGWTGATVDGVELVKSTKVAVNDAFIVDAEAVFIGESPLQTFRFDEVEGPGIIKLALWAYFVAKVVRTAGVVQITSAAA